jgi:hypothetical protein
MLITHFFPNPNEWVSEPPLNFVLIERYDIKVVDDLKDEDKLKKITEIKMRNELWGGTYSPLINFYGPSDIFIKNEIQSTQESTREHKVLVSFLKSNLQKAVRRRQVDIGLRTAKTLMKMDPTQFLRRLPIILCEDIGMHACFSGLVSLMVMVGKGYKLQKRDKNYIYGVIRWMCSSSKQIPPERIEKFDYKNLTKDVWNDMDMARKSVLMALYIRMNYGGMSGDMKMLKFWMKHVMSRGEFWTDVIQPKSSYDIPNFNFDTDTLDCAIDFHVFPDLIGNVHNNHSQFTKGQIKKAIWFCMSGPNYRMGAYVPEDYEEHLIVYECIKGTLLKLQMDKKGFIKRLF